MAANDNTAQFNAVATAVVNDLADGQRKIEELNKVAQQLGNGEVLYLARNDKVLGQMANGVNGDASARDPSDNGYMSLVARAQADEKPKYGNAMRSNDSPVMWRSAVARSDDPPLSYRSAVAVAQGHGYGFDKLDSVERSLQTIEAYIRTLEGQLPSTVTEPLGESFKEFKRALDNAETVIIQKHEASATPATPAPTPIANIIQAAVDEVMAEA